MVNRIRHLAGLPIRTFVLLSLLWSWLDFSRDSRLIIKKEWRFWGPAEPAG